jgi:glycosyltransferase involved in cell wall biosynthesis
MNVLFLSPWPPLPENSGMRQLTMNLLRYLSPRHRFEVVGFYKHDEERSSGWAALERELPLRVLASFPERRGSDLTRARIGLLARLLPASLARWHSRRAADYLASLDLSRYDAVILDTLYMATYGRLFRSRPTVLLAPDALAMGHLAAARDGFGLSFRTRRFLEALLQIRLERTWYPKFDAVTFVSDRDRSWVQRMSPRTRTRLVEIPVARGVFERGARNRSSPTATRVVCWAAVFEPAIARGVVEFIERSWPRIRAARPDAELIVWGQAPVQQVRAAMARDPSVSHLGFVDDWMETLCSMDLLVYPIRGGAGVFTKIQNALALGIPTVLSREAAWSQGLTPGRDAEVCHTHEEYASACIRLLSDWSERDRVGTAGREYALSTFGHDGPGQRLERVLEEVVAAHRAGARA